MIIERTKVEYPPNFDSYEEDCCGCRVSEKVTITIDEKTPVPCVLDLIYKKSGIGDEIQITARTPDGQVGKGTVHAYTDDDGNLQFYIENRTAR